MIKTYLRRVRRILSCSNSQKAAFLSQLEDELFLYWEDRDDLDMAGLTERFGTPEDMANNFLTELGPSAMWKYLQRRRRVLYIIAAVALAAIFLIMAMKIHMYIKQQDVLNSYFVESIISRGNSSTLPVYQVVTSDGPQWVYDAEEDTWEDISTPVQ